MNMVMQENILWEDIFLITAAEVICLQDCMKMSLPLINL